VLRRAFLPMADGDGVARVPRTLEFSAFALALAAILLGLFGAPLLDLLAIGQVA
jgi:hypothetical protein